VTTAETDKSTALLGALRPETVKHYVETIFYIQHEEERVRPGRIAEWLGVRPPTVSVTLQRLERDGWISVGADRTVSLTGEGTRLANTVVRVHRLLERWLTDVLGFDWATADTFAQEIAPGVSDEVADHLDEHLGLPVTCPHGNVIPGRKAPYGRLIALADLARGDSARVRRISEVAEHDAPDLLELLGRNGLVTGAVVSIADDGSSDDAVTVEIGGKAMALGTATARLIWVERAP
jgi:DtxR family Mn-dependent transcriptional regulator